MRRSHAYSPSGLQARVDQPGSQLGVTEDASQGVG